MKHGPINIKKYKNFCKRFARGMLVLIRRISEN